MEAKKYRAVFMPSMGTEAMFIGMIVNDPAEAVRQLEIVAGYTLYLHATSLMDDFSNAGWIEVLEDDEWVSVDDIDDLLRMHRMAINTP